MKLCLVLDDDPISAKTAGNIAGNLGLEVRVETNSMAALSFCDSQMPDIVILDVMMPRMDGRAFLHELRRKLDGRRPYVIVCSALGDIDTIKSMKDEDIQAYIVKPYSSEGLIKKIKESGKV